MKCIHCGADSRLRERRAGRCGRCRHRFAIEPSTDRNKVTDRQFKTAIDRVSGKGRVHFTPRNLWYEFNRRWMKPGFWRSPYAVLPFLGGGSVLGLVFGPGRGMVTAVVVLLVLVVTGAAAGFIVGFVLNWWTDRRAPRARRPPRVPYDAFKRQYLGRWRQAHGDIAGLLPARDVAVLSQPRNVPSDVAAFSFDRAVVTDRWETAAMLVANRFHFEHNCAVLSHDGYPDGIADTVKEMLRRNPRLTVFALHDATPGGCLLPITLGEPEWFPGARIVDLGLRPGMVRRLRIPALAGARVHPPARLAEILPAKDVAWLARGYTAELAALHPEQVLRAAYRGIVAAGPGDGSSGGDGSASGAGGDTYYGGGIIWVGDLGPGTDTAAVDGFG
jgi:DNA-directed RNA polymerase subunit RPC12/RpoP